ncbi:MAG: thiamine phosphate synthase [Geminicoccaceae bacterium]
MNKKRKTAVEEPSIDAEEAACRLLLHWPQEGLADDLPELPSLAGVIAQGGDLEAARSWLQGREAALFLAIDGPYDARALCDGAVVAFDAEMDGIRRQLGRDCIIGATCGTSRHAAMVAGERGADYVLFGQADDRAPVDEIVEILVWWRDLFVIPAAAAGIRTTEEAQAFLDAGADFLMPAADEPSSLTVAIDRMLAA